jgi:hypothetical protein
MLALFVVVVVMKPGNVGSICKQECSIWWSRYEGLACVSGGWILRVDVVVYGRSKSAAHMAGRRAIFIFRLQRQAAEWTGQKWRQVILLRAFRDSPLGFQVGRDRHSNSQLPF